MFHFSTCYKLDVLDLFWHIIQTFISAFHIKSDSDSGTFARYVEYWDFFFWGHRTDTQHQVTKIYIKYT